MYRSLVLSWVISSGHEPPPDANGISLQKDAFTQNHIQTEVTLTGWWFGTCFIFPYIGKNHPH